MTRKSAKPPLLTLDCLVCQSTWWYRTPGPHACEDCGAVLCVRIEGAEPFEPGSYLEPGTVIVAEEPATLPTLFDLLSVEAAAAHA